MSKNFHRRPQQESSSSNSANFLFAAFYLVVLAFFILLNSISTLEERKKQASIGSVKYVFSQSQSSSYLPYKVDVGQTSERISPYANIGNNLYSHLHNILTDSLSLIEAVISEDSEGVKIDIPLVTFFLFPSEKIRDNHDIFLSSIADKLKKNPQLSLKIILPNKTTQSYPTMGNNQAVRLAHRIIQHFISLNIPHNQLFIGIHSNSNRKFLRLHFTGEETQILSNSEASKTSTEAIHPPVTEGK